MSLIIPYREIGIAISVLAIIIVVGYISYFIIYPGCKSCGLEGFDNPENNYENIKNFWDNFEKVGDNRLVSIPNPTSQKYIIHQKQPHQDSENSANSPTPMPTYFSLSSTFDSNQYYQLDCMIRNESSNLDFYSIIQIVQYSENDVLYIPNKQIYVHTFNWKPNPKDMKNKDGQQIHEYIVPDETWHNIQIIFKIPSQSAPLPYSVLFMLPSESPEQWIILNDIKTVDTLLQSFPYSSNIVLYTDSRVESSYNGNGTIWNDLSGNNNSLRWSNRPYLVNDSFDIGSNKIYIIGQPSNFFTKGIDADKAEFTILLYGKMTAIDNKPGKYVSLITFEGNQKIGFELQLPAHKFAPLRYIVGDRLHQSDELIDPTQLNTYIITYKNKKISIWVNYEEVVRGEEVKIPYFKSANFVINKNKNLYMSLNSVMIYNKKIDGEDVGNIIHSIENYGNMSKQINMGRMIIISEGINQLNKKGNRKSLKERMKKNKKQ
jgi:hypothetical protein